MGHHFTGGKPRAAAVAPHAQRFENVTHVELEAGVAGTGQAASRRATAFFEPGGDQPAAGLNKQASVTVN